MHRFFNRSPYEVARDLVGKTLQVGDAQAKIVRVEPQYPKQNENWTDRPLFGPHPVDAYVAPYRGKHLLFLRTGTLGTNTCVRIDGIEIEGQLYAKPSMVCEALGIDSERSGRTALSHGVVSISWS